MNSITVTVNLSAEDRARLDKIIEALTPQDLEPVKYAGAVQVEPQTATASGMTMGEQIKARREELGLTQRDLAGLVGYSNHSTVARVEADEVNLPHSKIVEFAKALQVTPGFLTGWDAPPAPPATTEQPEPAAEPQTATTEQPEPAPQPEQPEQPEQPAPAAPQHTRAELQHLVVTLTSAGKKAEVRAIVLAVAPKVSDIPEDKINEVFEQLKALEG